MKKSLFILFSLILVSAMTSASYAQANNKAVEQNLFPQISESEGYTVRGAGDLENNLRYAYRYDYSQKKTWSYHGIDILVDPNQTYTYSFDAYISNNANIPSTGQTFIANIEKGLSPSFHYDNTLKGTWQHFEFTGKPTSDTVRTLLYPTTDKLPATSGYVEYQNVEFHKVGSSHNLFPQVSTDNEFAINGAGIIKCNPYSSSIYQYDYSQNVKNTYSGFDLKVTPNQTYTFKFDAFISSDANIPSEGLTFIANVEKGFWPEFKYDNSLKGTWQHFEFTGKPTSEVARVLMYPSTELIPATTGYVLYKNLEFTEANSIKNRLPQPTEYDGFNIRHNGVFSTRLSFMYSYDYSQKLKRTWHGFDIDVDPNETYTYSLDAYIAPETDIPLTGKTFIANGEKGFYTTFEYDNSRRGTWQHFEFTGKPTSNVARLLLYPSNEVILANMGYVLYRNVEFMKKGVEWNQYINFSRGIINKYDETGRLIEVYKKISQIPVMKYQYDTNGNLLKKITILQ